MRRLSQLLLFMRETMRGISQVMIQDHDVSQLPRQELAEMLDGVCQTMNEVKGQVASGQWDSAQHRNMEARMEAIEERLKKLRADPTLQAQPASD